MVIVGLTLGCFIAFFALPVDYDPSIRMIILDIGFLVGFLFGFFTIVASIFTHIDNIGVIRLGDERIAMAEDRLTKLKTSIKDVLGSDSLNEDLLIRANKDNPISQLIESIDNSVKNLEYENTRIIEAKETIAARKIGPLQFVVSLYGEE